MRIVYLNGQFVPEAEAKLSIYDLSVMQAAAAFEMTRSFHGQHFKLREHLDRLFNSCDLLSIPRPRYGFNELYDLCHEVTRLNDHGPDEEHRLLIVVSPGCAPMYRDLEGTIDHPFVYIADFPLRYTVQGFGKYFTEGVHCVTSKIQQVPDACIPSAAKHRSRLHFHLAQQQAPTGTWPILTDAEGRICEAPGANILYVDHGQIYTIEDNCLSGISIRTVHQIWNNTALAIGTCLSGLQRAEEVWIAGTPYCLLPVVSIDGRLVGSGKVGQVYKDTMLQWNAMVGLDIAAQIQEWDGNRVIT